MAANTWEERDDGLDATAMSDGVRVERRGAVMTVILDRPKANAINGATSRALGAAFIAYRDDPELRAAIITAAGDRFFSAGWDLNSAEEESAEVDNGPGGFAGLTELFDLQKPVIAQIHGSCLAGATELAGFCDLRVVADDAEIGWPVGRNWSPGNLQYMPWLVGMTKAKYYMFTCEPMSGVEAAQCQWASESVPADRLEERTEELAQQIALTPTDLIMLTKRSITRQFEIMGFRTGISASVDILAVSSFREQGIYSRKSRSRTGESAGGGDEFMMRSHRDGLKAALKWREEKFGNRYRERDESTSED